MQELSELSIEETYGTERGTFTIDDSRDGSNIDSYARKTYEDELGRLRIEVQGLRGYGRLLSTRSQLSDLHVREAKMETRRLRSQLTEWNSLSRWREKRIEAVAPKKSSLRWAVVTCVFSAVAIYWWSKSYNWLVFIEFALSTFDLQFEGRPPF